MNDYYFTFDVFSIVSNYIDNVKDMMTLRLLSKRHYDDHLICKSYVNILFEYTLRNKKFPIYTVLEIFPEMANMYSKMNRSTLMHRQNISIFDFQCLLSLGSDINARDINGNTPLHIASMFSVPTLRWMIKAGADTSLVNNMGQNILHVVDSTIGAAIIMYKNMSLIDQIDENKNTPYTTNRYVSYALLLDNHIPMTDHLTISSLIE